MALKENYKDDILDTSQNVKRKYQMENNGDGTVSFTDVTEYTQQGDSFGSGAINPIAHAINGLNNYNFHPSGSIDLVAYIADDSYYLNEDNKYVLADSPTGQALITSEPSTYKALASDTDLYGIEGEDTVSGFEPSCTPITVGGETLSTIDDKLNYLIEGNDLDLSIYRSKSSSMTVSDLNIGKQYLIAITSVYRNLNSYLIQSNISGGILKSKMVSGATVQRSGEAAECAVALIEATATSITFNWYGEQGLGIAWIQFD